MTGKIFINYRREDSAGIALALFGRLEQSFLTEQLFMDVEGSILAGDDFVQALAEAVKTCDVLLALIGPAWLTLRDETGQRRLDNPKDFVRIEIESALRLGKRVIPVLVHRTEMPLEAALPEPLQPLVRRNALRLTHERFRSDAQGLINAIESALADEQESPTRPATEWQRRDVAGAANGEELTQARKGATRLKAAVGLSPERFDEAEELANPRFAKAAEHSPPQRSKPRVEWPQGSRIGLLLAFALFVAVIGGLVVRIIPQQSTNEKYTSPPSIFLTGGLATSKRDTTINALLQSGYDQNGPLNIFSSPVSLSIFDVTKDEIKSIYQSQPNQFDSVYRSTQVQNISIPYLPLRAAFCLVYTDPVSSSRKAAISGFTLAFPQSATATVTIDAFAGTETFSAPEPRSDSCSGLVKAYAKQHLKNASRLSLDATMAGQETKLPLSVSCRRDRENPALISCQLPSSPDDVTTTNILAGFDRDKLNYSIRPPTGGTAVGGSYNATRTFFLPNLGKQVFLARHYPDNSTGALSNAPVDAPDVRPPTVSLKAKVGDLPEVYVAYDSNYLPRWGLVVMAPEGTQEVSWSRDGRGYNKMSTRVNVADALITPGAFGIESSSSPPASDERVLWVKLIGADGIPHVSQYSVDFWNIARQGLRIIQPVEKNIVCSKEILSSVHDTRAAICRPDNSHQGAVGLLLKRVQVGLSEETLEDATTNWRACGATPTPLGCMVPLYSGPIDATTVFFKFTYWDGLTTGLVAAPVN